MALKKKTLTRDGNRCVLTGMADMRWYYDMVCWSYMCLVLPELLKLSGLLAADAEDNRTGVIARVLAPARLNAPIFSHLRSPLQIR